MWNLELEKVTHDGSGLIGELCDESCVLHSGRVIKSWADWDS